MQNDRNLLFGILAMQMDFVSREQLIAAVSGWMLEKATPLAEILLRQRAMGCDERALLEALVSTHLAKHNDDPAQSLAAVSSIGSVKEELEKLGDADVLASLRQVAVSRGDDQWGTRLLTVGEPTSAGTRFRILRPHAEGGLGVVSVARDKELGREVALKEIKPRNADEPQMRARFLLEAEITGGLEHPGIVPVYGLGQYADGRPYYAMRFIRGHDLLGAIDAYHSPKGKAMSPGERALVLRKLLGRFLDVCNAIAYAHSRGVLHRDLKPGNIMLGQYGETLVVDWGLAKAASLPACADCDTIAWSETPLKPSSGSGVTPTEFGRAVGTVQYMSPEQAAGQIDILGVPSDVYSLGATLYHLLVGRPSFSDQEVRKDVGAVLQKVQRGEFPRPRQLDAAVPAALEAICLKAMARKPEERYATPRALADDVERWLGDEPVLAHPDPLIARVARTARRHKVATATTAALLIAAVVGLSVGTVLLGREQSRTQKARRDAEKNLVTAEAARADAVVSENRERVEREMAQKQLLRSEWLLYASQISSAQFAWETNDAALAWHHLDASHAEFRGWEHDYLYTLFNQNQRTHKGHTDRVLCVAFSPDGERIVSGSDDRTLRIWDTAHGRDPLTLTGHTGSVFSVAFSPDGKRIISGSWDHTLKVWDAVSGQATFTLTGHSGSVNSVAFSPDGKQIASGSFDRSIKIWDAVSGRETRTLKGHQGPVASVAFSPDGKRIASGSGDNSIRVWDLVGGQETLALKGHLDAVTSVAFSPDGKRIVSGSEDRTVRIWDAAGGTQTGTLKGHTDAVRGVAFSPDGDHIVSASLDKTLKVWDAASGRETITLKGHTEPVSSVAFSPDGKSIVSGSWDKTLKVWAADNSQETLTLRGHADQVGSVAFSPDGKRIVSGSGDKTLKVWDATTGEELFALEGHLEQIDSVAFSPDGKWIVSASWDNTLKVWDAASGDEMHSLTGHNGAVTCVAISLDGKRIVSSSLEGTLKIWDPDSGVETLTLQGNTGQIYSVAISPDGKRIVSGNDDKTLKVWDAAGGTEMLTLKGHTDQVNCVAFSFDGKRIVSGSNDGTVKVWDAASGQLMLTLEGHTDPVRTVVFSPDGKRIASGSDDKTLKIWDAASGQETLTLKGHTDPVLSVAFSPDGKRIVSGSSDKKLRVWDASSGPAQ